MEWIILVLAVICGSFYSVAKDFKQRIERLESKVYDLEENTVKKKQEWDL